MMTWHDFILSKKAPNKYFRHIAFWWVWALYFFCGRYFLPQPALTDKLQYPNFTGLDFCQLSLILFIQMAGCYLYMYVILPKLFFKAKYISFVLTTILLSAIIVMATHFISVAISPFLNNHIVGNRIREAVNSSTWFSISNGGINFIKIIIAASAIKITQRLWSKQKEKESLEKEKINAELQLLKAQIHPHFLFNTLNNIYSSAVKGSAEAPEMLMKLSEILSYMLYECNDREVSLSKEIKMLNDYMTLGKMRFGGKLEMNLLVKGNTSEETIAPLLLLHFIENSFKQCGSSMTEQPWINLEIKIKDHSLDFKLMNGKPMVKKANEETEDTGLQQVQKRLQFLYPNRHKLKITEEPEIMIVSLWVDLQELENNKEGLLEKNKQPVNNIQELSAT